MCVKIRYGKTITTETLTDQTKKKTNKQTHKNSRKKEWNKRRREKKIISANKTTAATTVTLAIAVNINQFLLLFLFCGLWLVLIFYFFGFCFCFLLSCIVYLTCSLAFLSIAVVVVVCYCKNSTSKNVSQHKSIDFILLVVDGLFPLRIIWLVCGLTFHWALWALNNNDRTTLSLSPLCESVCICIRFGFDSHYKCMRVSWQREEIKSNNN